MKKSKGMKIVSVSVKAIPDKSPDTSWLGEYTDKWGPWTIDRNSGKYLCEMGDDESVTPAGREYRFFKPYGRGEKEGSEEYKRTGLVDFERMESLVAGNWEFIGIRGEAEIEGSPHYWTNPITTPGLWGIESDSGKSYLKEVADEELAQLRKDLLDCSFTKKAIDLAFEDVDFDF